VLYPLSYEGDPYCFRWSELQEVGRQNGEAGPYDLSGTCAAPVSRDGSGANGTNNSEEALLACRAGKASATPIIGMSRPTRGYVARSAGLTAGKW